MHACCRRCCREDGSCARRTNPALRMRSGLRELYTRSGRWKANARPAALTTRSKPWMSTGNRMKPAGGRPALPAIEPPSTMAAMISAEMDSKWSAPLLAQSPTLSPTRSATTAGLRGSSSSRWASTLPTRSAPTSAALVKMPPPSCANSATNEAPNPKPTISSGISSGGRPASAAAPPNTSCSRENRNTTPVTTRPTTISAGIAPDTIATCIVAWKDTLAAAATRALARTQMNSPV